MIYRVLFLFVFFLALANAAAANNLRALESEDSIVAAGKGNNKCKGKKAKAITEDDVWNALNRWGTGLVSISTTAKNNGDYIKVAREVIENNYNYLEGTTLFKPTLAVTVPVRTTFNGALSYFVGGNPDFAEDGDLGKGFAAKNPFKEVDWELAGIALNGKTAQTQGLKLLKLDNDNVITAHFSMSFIQDACGDLNIQLHHSSLPYSPSP